MHKGKPHTNKQKRRKQLGRGGTTSKSTKTKCRKCIKKKAFK